MRSVMTDLRVVHGFATLSLRISTRCKYTVNILIIKDYG